MSLFVFANNVNTTLASPISSTATTIPLASSTNFPSIPAGYVWAVTLNDQATQTIFEIVYVTSTSGSNLTVLRGQEGTTARAWNTGDFAFAADTAGILSSFVNQAQLAGYVQLSPALQQGGSINVSGNINSGAGGSFSGGLNVGGPLNVANTGSFTGDLGALDFISSRAYANTSISNLPIRLNGGSSLIGIGPSSGLSFRGVTASLLALGYAASGLVIAIDNTGNIATPGNFYGASAAMTSELLAPVILQNGNQVIDTLTSSTLTLTDNGHGWDVEIPNTGLPVGAALVSDGNGVGSAISISLPNYGQWFVEVIFAVQETTNTNMTITLSLTGGTMTGGFLSNANGHTAFNSQSIITIYGKGHTSVNNQTLTFDLSVSGGAFDPSNQPWVIKATRTG